ncbi:hypothetical protein B0H11DRAFT_35546 [Mycena galericulata]|nr:hypothetical protein B0H11DRAFT_35546 [Mycena galericulata]
MELTTTRSTLMHAVLAHISPPLREYDLIAFGKLRRRTRPRPLSLSSLPTEILLLIRFHLLPVLITHFIATSATSLQHYEASLRYLVCPQCTSYNEYVYGLDVWKWHLSGPCSCSPTAPATHRPNPTQFRDRHQWLETYLSRKSLRFRGLSPQSSHSSTAIWDVVTDVLGDFGCGVTRRNPGRRGVGMPLLSRWDRQSILVVPLNSNSGAGGDCHWATSVLFRRLEIELGLSSDYNEPRHAFPSLTPLPNFAVPFEQPSPCVNAPIIATGFLLQILETVTAPLTAVLSIVFSLLTLLCTVLCYYSRPGALRLL